MRKTRSQFLMLMMIVLLVLTACSEDEASSEKKEDPYNQQAEEKNAELELAPIEISSYGKEIGATFKAPKYQEFAVNGKVVIEGAIEDYSQLKEDYAWIKVASAKEGPAGKDHEYYTPIQEGKLKQDIHFFNGEGEYNISIQLPSKDRENYFYDTIEFKVINVNPEMKRDISYTPFGNEVELAIEMDSSFVEADGVFSLNGKAGKLADAETIMLALKKDSETWKHVIPVQNGHFSYDVPLFYGEGIHELEVLVPHQEQENYYQVGTSILIDNQSNQLMEPIIFSDIYLERGVTLEYPTYGGEEADDSYRIKGKLDPKAELAAETTHLYITTKKGEDEALDVIPVENFQFDDSFYLRFGPGTYEVTVSVPEIHKENRDYFRYFGFAQFKVDSKAEKDERDLLPSRGVQSDDPKIVELANQMTGWKANDREKAKAIYDYVAQNVKYDVQKYKNDEFRWDDSALKTLELKSGVCQDYAFLVIALLRASDIEARFIEGRAGGGAFPGRHAWVEAKVDGNWLTMDPTWGSGYLQNDQFVAKFTDKYFDPDMEEFTKTHTRTGVSY
ncbi:transglutaminase-like domain-containing protein [Niallia sp. Krafla_26]|uniref:transglutaminase-like domain-containing protein n=1 Tax=Niallia sp. Krafla_26 TaxID=3064703 RepID=UPI003D169F05